jgi:hypothetical protein
MLLGNPNKIYFFATNVEMKNATPDEFPKIIMNAT